MQTTSSHVRAACLAMTLVGLAPVSALAQLDLRGWTLVDPYNRWQTSNPAITSCRMDETGSSATVGPGWVVSPFGLSSTTDFEVTIQQLTSGDDDLFGIAFSYQSNTRHLLLDWKASGQTFNWGDTVAVNDDTAETGVKIKRIDGAWTRDGLWGGTDGLGVSTLAGPLAPGWATNAVYRFQFSITPGRVVVRRNGTQIFDLTSPAVTGGRIAFYSFSQDDVVFSNVQATNFACGLSDVAGSNQAAGPDGFLTADDIIVFLSWYFANDPRADVAGPNQGTTPDNQFTADDVILYLSRYFAGC